jgi:hypothetical protein
MISAKTEVKRYNKNEEDNESEFEIYLKENVNALKVFKSSYRAFMMENYPPELTRF